VLAEPAKNFLIGARHVTTNKEAITPGKLMFYFLNQTPGNRFTTEFTYDYANKALSARVGATHSFTQDVMGYLKVNNKGNLDGMLKVKLNSAVHVCVASGMTLQNITEQKAQAVPLGFKFYLFL